MRKLNAGAQKILKQIMDHRGDYTDPTVRYYMLGIINCALNSSEKTNSDVFRSIMCPYDIMKGNEGGGRGLQIRWHGREYTVTINISYPYGRYGKIPTLTYSDMNGRPVIVEYPAGADFVKAITNEVDRDRGNLKRNEDNDDDYDDEDDDYEEQDDDGDGEEF